MSCLFNLTYLKEPLCFAQWLLVLILIESQMQDREDKIYFGYPFLAQNRFPETMR